MCFVPFLIEMSSLRLVSVSASDGALICDI